MGDFIKTIRIYLGGFTKESDMVIFAFEKFQSGRKEMDGYEGYAARKTQKEQIKLICTLGPMKWRPPQ